LDLSWIAISIPDLLITVNRIKSTGRSAPIKSKVSKGIKERIFFIVAYLVTGFVVSLTSSPINIS
jgi:hypothetical protein